MEALSKFLNLSIDATQIYLECLGKFPLNFNEICLLKPDFSKDKIESIINELKERNLLKVIEQSPSLGINRYFAIPPFKLLRDGLIELKKFIEKDGYAQKKIEAINETIFFKQNKIEYETIFKEFLSIKQNVENYINLFKKDSETVASTKSEGSEENHEILKKTEQELNNMINSELASIVVALLQLKSELKDKITEAGINNSQWNIIKNSIKDVLALHTHEKAKELNEIITEEFKELSLKLKPISSSFIKNQKEEKGKHFDILNKIQEDIEIMHSDFISKIKDLKIDLKELEKTINFNMSETLQALLNDFLINIEFFDQFLDLILKNYLEKNLSNFEKFNLISNKSKFKAEISQIIRNSKNFVFVIIPKLEDYIKTEDIKNAVNNLQIKIASTDSYESDIVKEIGLIENVEFRRYNEVNIIGINGDNESVIIGTTSELEKDVIFISSNYIPLINLFNFTLIKKWEESQPPVNMVLINHINNILENINTLKGNEISAILKEISDIIVNIEGISLDLLEIKLLTSKLKQIDKLLENSFKTQVIEKIKKLNEEIKRKK